MRIINIINDLRIGGTEKSLINYCLNDKLNENIVLSLAKTGANKELLIDNNIKLYELDFKKNLFKSVKTIIKICKEFKPDIIHSWMYHSHIISFITSFFGFKVCWSIRNEDISKSSVGLITHILIRLLGFLSNFKIKYIIFNSTAAKLSHSYAGFSLSKSFVVFNGFELNNRIDFDKLNSNTNYLIGSVGRYHPVKNHDLIFNALKIIIKKNKNIKICFVGKGFNYTNKTLIDKLNNLGIYNNVILKDFIFDMEKQYKKFDFTILSSNHESFPNVIAESMINGVPVISTDVGDARKIISDYGILIKKNSLNELVNAINSFLIKIEEKENWLDLKKNAHIYIKDNFSNEIMFENFNRIFKS